MPPFLTDRRSKAPGDQSKRDVDIDIHVHDSKSERPGGI
jgi:hypothetical protein